MKKAAWKLYIRPRLLIWLLLPFAIWWFGRDVAFTEWQRLIRSIDPALLVLLVIINLVALFSISARWWLVLRAMGWRLPYLAVLRYRMAAFSVSYFTPGSQFGGEPLQVYLLETQHSITRSSALASVTVEKLFELLANFTFLAVGLTLMLQSRLFAGAAPILAVIWTGVLLVLPLGYLVLLGLDRRPFEWLLSRLPDRLQTARLLQQTRLLAAETEILAARWVRQSPRRVIGVMLVSLWFWLLTVAEYWLALHVLGATLSLPQTILALTAARIAFLMPVPGGLGALEAGQVLAMQVLGFNPALGIAVSLWIRVRDLSLGALGMIWGASLVGSRAAPALAPETGD